MMPVLRVKSWLLAAAVLAASTIAAMPALAGGEHTSSPDGPLTALTRLSSAPALAEAQSRRLGLDVRVQQWLTPEGLRVLYWPNDQIPLLDARLIFDAGAARDDDLPGLASAVSSLMNEGTPQFTAQQVAERFERVGAEFSAASYRDMALLQLRTLSQPEYRDQALDMLAEVATHPAFEAAAWQRLQESLRIGQRQRQQSPSGRAGLQFYQQLYGDHPYANPPAGLASSVQRITPADLKAFHARYYTVRNAVLVLVGDIDRKTAETIAANFSQRLPAGDAAPQLPEPEPLKKAKRQHIEMPSQQTFVLLGELGLSRLDPDYFPLLVANEILGGSGFGSVLTRELREKRGLTYSVNSQFVPMRMPGPFQISFSTRADQAEAALKLTQQLLADFVRTGPDAAAVNNAIAQLTQAFPRSLMRSDAVASYLAMMGFYQLPADYLSRYVEQLAAVTPAQVQSALQRRVHPDRLVIITAGQKEAKP
ncbi:MAG: pitrilysin family protein [Pseudomonadota bacterium]